jgi:hypothetical protein
VETLAAQRPDLAVTADAATRPPARYILVQQLGTGQRSPARYWLVRAACRSVVNCYPIREPQA